MSAEEKNLVRLASANEVGAGPHCVSANGLHLAVFNVEGKYYAVKNECPHAGGPLCEGELADGVVTCPWHGSKFDVRTGAIVNGPAAAPAKTYPVEVRGEDIFVQL